MNRPELAAACFELPPHSGYVVTHFLTVTDLERSIGFYTSVFDGVLVRGGATAGPAYIQLANTWLILNTGGGPTPDKPTVTLQVPADPNTVSSFLNLRVADVAACYALWKGRGAEFLTEPLPKHGEIRCYIRDPDGYLIEVGQSEPPPEPRPSV